MSENTAYKTDESTDNSDSTENSKENTPKKSDGFDSLGLCHEVMQALDDVGYETPSPIQAAMIPYLLDGRDVLGQAQTGTGKTAAFALPLLSKLDPEQRTPQILVLAPTRELAGQVAENFQTYAKHMHGVKVLPIYGGQDYKIQLNALQRGVQIVVGTPGRVIDHIKRGSLKIHQLQALVLDEADEMLRMGFIDDVEWILGHTPDDRQVALFSATMPHQIHKIARKYLNDPEEIHIKATAHNSKNIRQRMLVTANGHQKQEYLNLILEAEPIDGVIIFARTKSATVEIAGNLREGGYKCSALNGDMMQRERERTVEQLKNGRLDILIATDVAARGLDVERISHVINYDIPTDNEVYIHRIGRTGRAGRSGDAILFIKPAERRRLRGLEQLTKQKIESMPLPSIDNINKVRIDKFKKSIDFTLNGGAQKSKDYAMFQKILADYASENDVEMIDIAAAMAKLAQGETPLLRNEMSKAQRATQSRDRDRDRGSDRGGRNSSYGDRSDRGRGGREERYGNNKRRDGRREGKSDDRPNRAPRALESGMERYRIELGRNQDVKPGSIVGAIAGETGMDGSVIGQINIQQDHTFVDLPADLPKEMMRDLQKTRIGGDRIMIKSTSEGGSSDSSWSPNNDNIEFDTPRKQKKQDRYQGRGRDDKPRGDRGRDDRSRGGRAPRRDEERSGSRGGYDRKPNNNYGGGNKRNERGSERSSERGEKRNDRRDEGRGRPEKKYEKRDDKGSDNRNDSYGSKAGGAHKKSSFSAKGALRAAKSFKAAGGKPKKGGKVMRGKVSRKP